MGTESKITQREFTIFGTHNMKIFNTLIFDIHLKVYGCMTDYVTSDRISKKFIFLRHFKNCEEIE